MLQLCYGARIVDRHNRVVNTAIIYSGRIESAPDLLQKGSLTYQVTNVYLKGMDGDEEYRRIKAKLDKGETLEESDLIKLIFLPLMKSKQIEAEMALKAAELAKAANNKFTSFVIGAIVAITDNFLPEEYKKRLLEVLRMTQIEQWLREEGKLEGKLEGKIEGKIEGKLEGQLEAARNALKKGLSFDDVAEITGLPKETVQKLMV